MASRIRTGVYVFLDSCSLLRWVKHVCKYEWNAKEKEREMKCFCTPFFVKLSWKCLYGHGKKYGGCWEKWE